MNEIRLQGGRWWFDSNVQLGPIGGFGAVYTGMDEHGEPVAVKQLHIYASDAAHRELEIASSLMARSLLHVLPILDAGLDAESDRYYLVMSRADYSLQQDLERTGLLTDRAAIGILRQIATGLAEVQDLTHRDLKPDNILYHEGYWKIADFGIARFVEESTSPRTLKDCLTYAYAAPEQLRLERATAATDIYALGCIAYTLLTGTPPFAGTRDDIIELHLKASPLPLSSAHLPVLRNLVSMMLRKPPQVRPSIQRVIQLLDNCAESISPSNSNAGVDALAQAGVYVAEQSARAEAAAEQQRTQAQRRQEIADAAFQILNELAKTLAVELTRVAPNVHWHTDRRQFLHVQLGTANLQILPLMTRHPISADAFPRSRWDVVAGAVIKVAQPSPNEYVWGANLWYMKWGKFHEYRWIEACYMTNPLMRKQSRFQPFAVDKIEDADDAADRAITAVQFAARPRSIDDEAAQEFFERWAELFALAAKGRLTHPSKLPLD